MPNDPDARGDDLAPLHPHATTNASISPSRTRSWRETQPAEDRLLAQWRPVAASGSSASHDRLSSPRSSGL